MFTSFEAIAEEAKKRGGRKIAVAGAEGKAILEAVKIARENGIMEPLLVGNSIEIEKFAKELHFDLEGITLYDKKDENAIAEKAVELVHTGYAEGLMKGKVNTPTILKAVLNKKFNLRTNRLLTHIALLEIPTYHKLLMITDGGMVIYPTLEQKIEILKNGTEMMQKLGVKKPKVAILAAIEKVNQDMPETKDAEILTQMAERGELGNVQVEGPLAVDVVMSPEAAKIKGVESRISGDPDILLVPNIACGNIFAKGLIHFTKSKVGGLVLGAKKPIILLSRSDNADTKFNSIVLGVIIS